MFYWLLKYVLVGPFLHLFFRPRVEGVHHIPARGPAILASNHLSMVDPLVMPLRVPRRVTFLTKSEYFTGKGIKGLLSRTFFAWAGQVPIDRSDASAADAALQAGLRILRAGHLLGIYPEGTRSPDGRLYRGKTGVARLVLETGVPVIPVVMIGSEKIQPFGQKYPRIFVRTVVRFGPPLDFSRYAGKSGDRLVERSLTDELMYELMHMSGQEYVDVYAAKVKAELRRQASGGAASTDRAEAA